jgi:DNA-binding MarR family transcriptional regulator
MGSNIMDNEYNARLNNIIDDIMVQFPMVARKIMIATKSKPQTVSSGMQIRLLEGLMICPMKPSEISQVHGISRPNVTTLIGKLIDQGLAQRSHDENDRRVVFISITDKGKRATLRYRKFVKEYLLNKVFNQINPDEVEEVLASMAKFRSLLIKVNSLI